MSKTDRTATAAQTQSKGGRFRRERLPDPRSYFEGWNLPKWKAHGTGATALCPFHDDHNPSLSVDLETGNWKCHAASCGEHGDLIEFEMKRSGKSFKDAAQTLGAWDDTDTPSVSLAQGAQQRSAKPVKRDGQNRGEYVAKILAECRPIDGTAAEGYLLERGIARPAGGWPAGLLFHPGLPYPKAELIEGASVRMPALVVRVEDAAGKLLAIHRTFFRTPDKSLLKDPESRPERRFGLNVEATASSGVARLASPEFDEIGIAEGIETALAAAQIASMPIIPATNAALLQEADLGFFEGLKRVVVFGDNDPKDGGLIAARKLAERILRGTQSVERVLILMPPTVGEDWNDVLQLGEEKAVAVMSESFARASDPEARLSFDRKTIREEKRAAAMADFLSLGIERVGTLDAYSKPEPQLDFLVNGLGFLAGTAGMIAAPGSTGKGFFMLQMAMAIANEEDDHGFLFGDRDGLFVPEKRGRVVVLMAEDPADILRQRQRRIAHYGRHVARTISDKGLRSIDANLDVLTLFGSKEVPRLVEAGGEVTATCERWIDRISAIADGARLVIIDTLACFHGADENSNGEMTTLIQMLNRICKNAGPATLGSHHTNKAAVGSGNNDQSSARGASALVDNSRWGFNLSRPPVSENDDGAGTLMNKGFQVAQSETARWFVRANQAKANYSSPLDELMLRRVGAREGEHEFGGVLVRAERLNEVNRNESPDVVQIGSKTVRRADF